MTPAMSTPVDKKTRTGRALSANPSQPLNDSVTDQLAAIPDLSRISTGFGACCSAS